MSIKLLTLSGSAALLVALAASAPAMALDAAAGVSTSHTNGTASASASTATQASELSKLKTRGDAEIGRRLVSLNKLASVISSAVNLSSSDKSSLSSEVSSEISDLTSLKTQLDGETTVAAAQADAQSIVTNYRVYALILPKVYLLKAADTELVNNTKLSTLAGKLQNRLNAARSQGKDVTSLQTTLNDMTSQISSAQGLASAVETKVEPLQPTDYNSDHTILEGLRSQLQTAHQDNVAAYNDAKTIVSGIKSL